MADLRTGKPRKKRPGTPFVTWNKWRNGRRLIQGNPVLLPLRIRARANRILAIDVLCFFFVFHSKKPLVDDHVAFRATQVLFCVVFLLVCKTFSCFKRVLSQFDGQPLDTVTKLCKLFFSAYIERDERILITHFFVKHFHGIIKSHSFIHLGFLWASGRWRGWCLALSRLPSFHESIRERGRSSRELALRVVTRCLQELVVCSVGGKEKNRRNSVKVSLFTSLD